RHPGSTLTPLFAQIYETAGQPEEAVFVATGGSDGDRFGFVSESDSGPVFVDDAPLPPGTTALTFAVEGVNVPRLIVVAAPGSTLAYAPDGISFLSMSAVDGVGIIPLKGDQTKDRVRVTGTDGTVVYDEPAPDYGV